MQPDNKGTGWPAGHRGVANPILVQRKVGDLSPLSSFYLAGSAQS